MTPPDEPSRLTPEEAAARSPAVGDVWVEPTGAVRVVYDVAANGYAIAATFSGRTRALQGRPGSHSIAPSPGRFAGRVDPAPEVDCTAWRLSLSSLGARRALRFVPARPHCSASLRQERVLRALARAAGIEVF